MLKFLVCSLVTIIAFVLYCCIRFSSEHEKEIDDMEQEEFLRNWK